MRRLLVAVLVTGFLLDLTDWAWQRVRAGLPLGQGGHTRAVVECSRVRSRFRACVCLVPYLPPVESQLGSIEAATRPMTAAIVWLGGVAMCKLELATAGHFPGLGIAIATTLLALATFVVIAPLLPHLLPDRVATPT